MSKKILITEFMDTAAVDRLRQKFTVDYDPTLVDRPDELMAKLVDVDALIVRNRTQVNASLLAMAGKLAVVGRLGVGLDNIQMELCSQRNIQVIPATGSNAHAVAEYAITMALVLMRGAYLSSAEVVAGQWPRNELSNGHEVAGKKLGLIGFGSIGQLTAKMARALSMTTLAFDPAISADQVVWAREQTQCATLDQVIAESDVLSLHIPLLPSTKNLMDTERLAQMKKGAVLINTSRGGIVNESALAQSLKNGHLGGAALDVFTQEPLPAQNQLLGCPRLILTPHIAGVTHESNIRVSSMIADKVAAALNP